MKRWLLAILTGVSGTGCATTRPVEPQSVYRAAGLDAAKLEQSINQDHIRTVVNVSGFHPDQKWYREQAETCKKANVQLVDLNFNVDYPDREDVLRLIETYRTAPKPILLHARRESDGVGLAAGIYRLAILERPNREARKELAIWQYHQSPVASLRTHDRFLHEWRGEDAFRDTYQLQTNNLTREYSLASFPREPAPTIKLGKPIEPINVQ